MANPTPETGERLPNSVLAMIIFVVAEIMFFAALMSAHTIARATVMGGVWPPAGQPRLPVERTAFNTAILLLSGVLLFVSSRRARAGFPSRKGFLSGFLQGQLWSPLCKWRAVRKMQES